MIEHEIVSSPAQIKKEAWLVTLCKNVAETLHKHYPGHAWAVRVYDEHQGVLAIQNLALSGQWGFMMKLDDIDPDMKFVMRAGGDLLERYNLSRGRLRMDEMADVDYGLTGDAKPVHLDK